MKRMLVFLTVLVVTLTLFGCKQQSKEEFEMLGASTQSSSTEQPSGEPDSEEQPEAESTESEEESLPQEEATITENENPSTESSEKNTNETGLVWPEDKVERITFKFKDCEGLQLVRYDTYPLGSAPYVEFDYSRKTYDMVMDSIGEDGLIVVGSAFGERNGVRREPFNTPSTLTQFKIENVIYGTAPGDTITVVENYFPDFTSNNSLGEPCICYTYLYTYLKDNGRVLLFLKKNKNFEDRYNLAYYCLPVPENYAEYSKEGLGSLLDYYRGEESAYKKGYAKRWPQVTRSNEDVLKDQQDNILVRLATDHKVLVWPDGHTNFEGFSVPFMVRQGLREWSYPDGSPLKY